MGFFVLGMSLGTVSCNGKQNFENTVEKTREFDFYNSLIFQNRETKEVYLNVIINIKNYDMESMFEKIKEEYVLLNGRADELTLSLYTNLESLKSGNCLAEKVYFD